eukprot:CAMPEP_0117428880 /NCGR_PEP_ID=MMETSP0758-20121206/8492_1 /TAXON_ID=63605 /ORGANISM="Percolomonas cosmopolitus, Strain AE-1 (ATCC 50343)" /LENGTH=314 /DNA_ID=CAMNT_0005215487 /DNA_START=14 /DNA_END=958 /DNA_ORIENTATION=+
MNIDKVLVNIQKWNNFEDTCPDERGSDLFAKNVSIKDFATQAALITGAYTLIMQELDRVRIMRQVNPIPYMRRKEVVQAKQGAVQKFVEYTGKRPTLFTRGLSGVLLARMANVGVLTFGFALHRRDIEAHDVANKKLKFAGLFALQQYIAAYGDAVRVRQIMTGCSIKDLWKHYNYNIYKLGMNNGYGYYLARTGVMASSFLATTAVIEELYKATFKMPYYEPSKMGALLGGFAGGIVANYATLFLDSMRHTKVMTGFAFDNLPLRIYAGPTWKNTLFIGQTYRFHYPLIGAFLAFSLEQWFYAHTGSASFFSA